MPPLSLDQVGHILGATIAGLYAMSREQDIRDLLMEVATDDVLWEEIRRGVRVGERLGRIMAAKASTRRMKKVLPPGLSPTRPRRLVLS